MPEVPGAEGGMDCTLVMPDLRPVFTPSAMRTNPVNCVSGRKFVVAVGAGRSHELFRRLRHVRAHTLHNEAAEPPRDVVQLHQHAHYQ